MRQVFEMPAISRDDADGSRAAAVLAAYWRLDEVRVFCRLFMRRLVVLGLGWTVFTIVIPGMPRIALELGLALFAAGAITAVLIEHGAGSLLRVGADGAAARLLDRDRHGHRTLSTATARCGETSVAGDGTRDRPRS